MLNRLPTLLKPRRLTHLRFAVAYLVADMICKNLYGIINTNTLFRVLDGKWEPETDEDQQERSRDIGATYLEMMISRMRGGSTKSPAVFDALIHRVNMRS
eukprot:2055485-Rhodomonas_salina.2